MDAFKALFLDLLSKALVFISYLDVSSLLSALDFDAAFFGLDHGKMLMCLLVVVLSWIPGQVAQNERIGRR